MKAKSRALYDTFVDFPCRITGNHGIGCHIPGHHRTGAYKRAFSNGDPA